MSYWQTVCHLDGMEVVQQKFRDDGIAMGDHRILDLTGVDDKEWTKGTDLTFYRTTDGHSNVFVFRKEDGSTVRVGPSTSVGQLHNRL